MTRLRFFATKTAAHAPAQHPHLVQRDAQGVCHPMLRLARVLGAAVDQPFAVVLRQRVGDLPFQVIVFLPTNVQLAMQLMGRLGHGLCSVAALHMHAGQNLCHGV